MYFFLEIETRQQHDTLSEEDQVIVCRACNNIITRPFYKIPVSSSFSHIFANPHGHVFEIGCFSRAEGCMEASGLSSEFTWFAGYSWKIEICRQCKSHIGWIFICDCENASGMPVQFHGLILDKLVFP